MYNLLKVQSSQWGPRDYNSFLYYKLTIRAYKSNLWMSVVSLKFSLFITLKVM